jgi:hypothetical protein
VQFVSQQLDNTVHSVSIESSLQKLDIFFMNACLRLMSIKTDECFLTGGMTSTDKSHLFRGSFRDNKFFCLHFSGGNV